MANSFEMQKVVVLPSLNIPINTIFAKKKDDDTFTLHFSNADGSKILDLFTTAGSGGSAATSLDGPTEVYPGMRTEYKITNYDIRKVYIEPTAINGSVLRIKDRIYYTAPASGVAGFSFDGVDLPLTLSNERAAKPFITIPLDDIKNVGSNLLAVCTGLDALVTGLVYSGTRWELSTTPDFSANVISYTPDSETYLQIPTGVLQPGNKYYLRVRHSYVGSYTGNTVYSDTISFTTRKYFVPISEVGILYPPDYLTATKFGLVIAVSGNGRAMVIGAPNAKVGSNVNQGIVHTYIKELPSNIWRLETRITVNTANLFFGNSLALSYDGTTLAIGTAITSTKGSAYIYKKTGVTWAAQTVTTPTNFANGDLFGYSVALTADGNTLFVGAPNNNNGISTSGVIVSYTRSGSTWTQRTTFVHTDKQASDRLGSTVVCNATGTIVAAGARDRDAKNFTGPESGAVYIFTGTAASAFNQVAALVPELPVGGTYSKNLAAALSMNDAGDVVAYSSTLSGGTNTVTNYVYVYTGTGSTWTKTLSLVQNLGSTNAYTGASLSLDGSGDNLLIGSTNPTASGYAELYTNTYGTTWERSGKFEATNRTLNDLDTYGAAVCITKDGSEMFVGAPLESYNVTGFSSANMGCVYVYS